ncbi:methyltransferase domain-containing protein, partial [Candidatus Omnitrophota bacterium]
IIDFLCCPECAADLRLAAATQTAGEIESGCLICNGCARRYPIIDRIARILPEGVLKSEKKTTDSFEFAWKHYGPLLSENLNTEFLTLVKPWKEEDFKDKIVLDIGCGAGRLSRLASSYGAKHVFAIDLSQAVDTAYKLSKDYPNIHFFQSSLFYLPFKQRFDIIFSLGVLHHTPSARAGFKSILKHLRQGGSIGIWVYGREGNEIIGPLMNIFRVATTRLNCRARIKLAKVLVRLGEGGYRCISKFTNRIFYGEYLRYFNNQLSRQDREYVAFDFISTELVKYISENELKEWAKENNLTDICIIKRNLNSWSLTAKKI